MRTPRRQKLLPQFRLGAKLPERRPVRPTAKMVDADPNWIFSFIPPTDAEWAAYLAESRVRL